MQWIGQLLTSAAKPFQLWFVVGPWEGALRIRLGKVAGELGPGIHIRIPMLDRIYRESLRLRAISDSGLTMTTKDGKPVTVTVVVEFAIENLLRLYEELTNPEAVLIYRVQGIMSKMVATTDSHELTSIGLENRAMAEVPAKDWGLGRVRICVTNFVFARTYRLMTAEYRTLTGLDRTMQEKK